MQDFLNGLKVRLLKARKERDDETMKILQVAISDIEAAVARGKRPIEVKDCHSILRKIIQSNQETMECIEKMQNEGGKTSCDAEKLLRENEILESFLPKLLSKEEIEEFLEEVDPKYARILKAANDGQAIGLAMRAINAANKAVNGNDVKAIIEEVRHRF